MSDTTTPSSPLDGGLVLELPSGAHADAVAGLLARLTGNSLVTLELDALDLRTNTPWYALVDVHEQDGELGYMPSPVIVIDKDDDQPVAMMTQSIQRALIMCHVYEAELVAKLPEGHKYMLVTLNPGVGIVDPLKAMHQVHDTVEKRRAEEQAEQPQDEPTPADS